MFNYFFPLLTLLFIGLKLTGFIGWSWILVLSPILIGFAIYILIITFSFFVLWFVVSKESKTPKQLYKEDYFKYWK